MNVLARRPIRFKSKYHLSDNEHENLDVLVTVCKCYENENTP